MTLSVDIVRQVPEIMQAVAAEALLPRFRRLRDGDIEMKSPGEIVTIADREAERALAAALVRLLPGSRVVGEEAASVDADVLQHLDKGDVWLVDPLDGTANFVSGDPRFAVMVALLRQGQTVASWMLDPVRNVHVSARRGEGAYVGDVRIHAPQDVPNADALRGIVRNRFLPDDIRTQIDTRSACFGEMQTGAGCAGVDYPAVANGQPHFALYWRTLPWDHAAGVLFLSEAGGCALRLDGSPYAPADSRTGLLVACNAGVWSVTRELLLAPSTAQL